jgi:tetratricopeptide (TPR) repeat protein
MARQREAAEQRQLAQQRLDKAVEVADLIVFTLDRKLKNVAGAAEVRRELLEAGTRLLETLREGATDEQLELLRSRMTHHVQQGDLAVSHDDLGKALAEYRSAFEIAQRLSEQDPGNAEWQRDLSVSHNQIGGVLQAQGDLDAALAEFRAALGIAHSLATADPSNAGNRKDVLLSHLALMRVEAMADDEAAALRHLEEIGRILDEFEREDLFAEDAQIRGIRALYQALAAKIRTTSEKNTE